MATSESDLKQLKDLSSLVGIKLGDEELARFGAVDWEALFSRIKSLSAKQRVVIAIDEFPYLTKSNRAISSVFQKGWDLYLKDADAMLILSGSSISMMHSEVRDYSAPLFQRSTSILELKQLGIDYALSLNPRMKFEDRMQAYFIFGGVAAYYTYTEGSNGIKELLRNIFKPGSVSPRRAQHDTVGGDQKRGKVHRHTGYDSERSDKNGVGGRPTRPIPS